MEKPNDEAPFEGGAQPVREHPEEMPSGGRKVAQTIILVLGVLVILAAVLWILVPFSG